MLNTKYPRLLSRDATSLIIFTVLFFKSDSSTNVARAYKIANLISKLNFYKLIPYPMDNCFTGRRDWSRQMPEKGVTECAFARWRIVLPSSNEAQSAQKTLS